MAPLPHTVTELRGQVDGADVEPAELADPQPAAVQQLEHGVVAPPPPVGFVVGSGGVEQTVQLALIEHAGNRPPPPRTDTPLVGSAVTNSMLIAHR